MFLMALICNVLSIFTNNIKHAVVCFAIANSKSGDEMAVELTDFNSPQLVSAALPLVSSVTNLVTNFTKLF